tara:strand:- start:19444 stop:19965 length:522 start_codon:yes stop_codon:yes gene_type:complete
MSDLIKPKEEKNNTCNELKNIQYQNMLLNQKTDTPIPNTSENVMDLDVFLDKEKESNKKLPWTKLEKSLKIKKLNNFVKKYSSEHNLDKKQIQELGFYLKDCLERRKLQKQKDIEYDKISGCIKNIPNLIFNKQNNKFTLKCMEKSQSITKGLAPKSKKKTLKLKIKEKEKDK